MRVHELKCWPQVFTDTIDGLKLFEVRWDDRGFAVGDKLLLREWDNVKEEYTGRTCKRRVKYILRGGQFGIDEGYVVMGTVKAR